MTKKATKTMKGISLCFSHEDDRESGRGWFFQEQRQGGRRSRLYASRAEALLTATSEKIKWQNE